MCLHSVLTHAFSVFLALPQLQHRLCRDFLKQTWLFDHSRNLAESKTAGQNQERKKKTTNQQTNPKHKKTSSITILEAMIHKGTYTTCWFQGVSSPKPFLKSWVTSWALHEALSWCEQGCKGITKHKIWPWLSPAWLWQSCAQSHRACVRMPLVRPIKCCSLQLRRDKLN